KQELILAWRDAEYDLRSQRLARTEVESLGQTSPRVDCVGIGTSDSIPCTLPPRGIQQVPACDHRHRVTVRCEESGFINSGQQGGAELMTVDLYRAVASIANFQKEGRNIARIEITPCDQLQPIQVSPLMAV